MAADVGRWLKYAQARLNRIVSSSNDELDDLEAEQAARAADKPWLSADGDAPTLDEAKARIEWEAAEAQRTADSSTSPSEPSVPVAAPPKPSASEVSGSMPDPAGRPAPPAEPATPAGLPSIDPADPAVAQARLELERREREGKERLEAIRKELGVDHPPPAGPPPSGT